MSRQNSGASKICDMGRKAERKRQRELQKFVEEMADQAAEKCCEKLSKHLEKQMKKMCKRLDKLEGASFRPTDPDRDEDGFFQLRRR